MTDLKRCVKNVNLQQPWPGRREDFASEEAYQHWRTQELSSLSHIMMEMCQNNPELLRSTSNDVSAVSPSRPTASRPDSYSGSGAAASTPSNEKASELATPDAEFAGLSIDSADDDALTSFVYIPPDPRAYYHRALEICIDYDLEMIKHQPEEEEVSLSILSKKPRRAARRVCAALAPRVSVSCRIQLGSHQDQIRQRRGAARLRL